MHDQQKHRNLSTSHTRSSAPRASPKTVSPHVGFYKSFGRPIVKVFLGAVVTYQVTYLVWTKLETDEIKQQKRNKVLELETQLGQLSS